MLSIIELAIEVLLGRFELPPARYPECLLAQHEAGLFDLYRNQLSQAAHHRDDSVNRLVLPICRPLVEAIGHRMAYEAARDSQFVDKPLLDLFEATAVRLDAAWYSDNVALGLWDQQMMEERAATAAAKNLERYLEETNAEPYVYAPISSGKRWSGFAADLPCMEGKGKQMPIGPPSHDRRGPFDALPNYHSSEMSFRESARL